MNKPETIAAHKAKFEARLWSLIERTATCWIWHGPLDRDGYGRYHGGVGKAANGHPVRAHRWVYETLRGPIPTGFTLDHLCRNPGCVRPDHLEAVTMKENLARGRGVGALNAAKTHCHAGHPLSGDNLRGSAGCRVCRTCIRETQRARRALQLKGRRTHLGDRPIKAHTGRTPEERLRLADEYFWARIQKTDGCWIWSGPVSRSGYGLTNRLFAGGHKTIYAHIKTFELVFGPVPAGLELHHRCHVPRCVNPEHLEPMTHRENVQRRRT